MESIDQSQQTSPALHRSTIRAAFHSFYPELGECNLLHEIICVQGGSGGETDRLPEVFMLCVRFERVSVRDSVIEILSLLDY